MNTSFARRAERGGPVFATLAVFAVSGLMHEYVFGVATGRVQGWQMLFFMVQGCAAAATLRVRPTGWRGPAVVGRDAGVQPGDGGAVLSQRGRGDRVLSTVNGLGGSWASVTRACPCAGRRIGGATY